MAAMGTATPLGVHAVRGARRAAVPPEVGVPVPARHLRCCGPRRQGSQPGDRGPSHPPACGGLCRAPPGELPRGRRSRACAPPALLGSTPRGEAIRGVGVLPAARLRRAVPAPTGRTGPRSAFPCLRATCAAAVHADREAIRGGGVLPVRPPAAGGAGPHRENWPEVGVPLPARHLRCWGPRRERGHPGGRGPSRRPPAAGCAGPHRENWPEVGVPLPARHLRCWGPRRQESHPGGRGPSRPPAYGGLCRPPPGELAGGRRSLAWAPPALLGSTPRGRPSGGSGSVPSARLRRAVPTGSRRSRARAPPALLGSTPRGRPSGGRGPSHPPAYGGLCRPPPGELAGGRRSLACAPPALLGSAPRGRPSGGAGSFPSAHLRQGCADRRSAFPCLRATCAAGGPRREAGHPGGRGPSRPPACGGLCRRRSAFPCLHPVIAHRAAPSEQKLMAANLWFAARETGGKV